MHLWFVHWVTRRDLQVHITRSFLQLWVPLCLCMFCGSPSPHHPSQLKIQGLRFQQVLNSRVLVLKWKVPPLTSVRSTSSLVQTIILLAQFLDRPYAIHTGFLSQGPYVSVGPFRTLHTRSGASPLAFPQPLEPAASELFSRLRLEK